MSNSKWGAIDIALYKFFYQKMVDKIAIQGEDFKQEVESFKYLLSKLSTICDHTSLTKNDSLFLLDNQVSITSAECELMVLEEAELTRRAKRFQENRITAMKKSHG